MNAQETQKRSMSLVLVWGLGIFIEDNGVVYVSSQATRNRLEQRRGPKCYCLEPGWRS